MQYNNKYDEFDLSSNPDASGNRNVIVVSSDDEDLDNKKATMKRTVYDDDLTHKPASVYTIMVKDTLNIVQEYEQMGPKNLNRKSILAAILDTILQWVSPYKFIPYSVEFSKFRNIQFCVLDCDRAVSYILSTNNGKQRLKDLPLSCKSRLILGVSNNQFVKSLDISKALQKKIKNCFSTKSNDLDLSNFDLDHAGFYMPLWYKENQKILSLEIEDTLPSSVIDSINLSNNAIRDFRGFDFKILGSLNELNVTHNQIYNIINLTPFAGLHTKSFLLEFNPICHNYIRKEEYIKAAKQIFPTLLKLDGHFITEDSLPITVKNYSVDKNSIPIVGKFLEIFYTYFDSDDRSPMMDMYAKDAIFSISCSKTEAIFNKRARNLLNKNNSNIFSGPRSITGCLCWIPSTEHDPLSFCVDVVQYSSVHIILTISGYFKFPSHQVTQNEPILEFMRSFILVMEEDEYKIVNDMFHVNSKITPPQDAFRLTVKTSNKLTLSPVGVLPESTKSSLVDLLINITTLSPSEAYDCLEESKWNFQTAIKKAIEIFKKMP